MHSNFWGLARAKVEVYAVEICVVKIFMPLYLVYVKGILFLEYHQVAQGMPPNLKNSPVGETLESRKKYRMGDHSSNGHHTTQSF
jgi:hypothetical protein